MMVNNANTIYTRETSLHDSFKNHAQKRNDVLIVNWLKKRKDELATMFEACIPERGYGHVMTVLGCVSKCIAKEMEGDIPYDITWEQVFIILTVRSNAFIKRYIKPLYKTIAKCRQSIDKYGLSNEHPIMKYVHRLGVCIKKDKMWEYEFKKDTDFRFNLKSYILSYENVALYLEWIYNGQIFSSKLPKRKSMRQYELIINSVDMKNDKYLACDAETFFSEPRTRTSTNLCFVEDGSSMTDPIIVSDDDETPVVEKRKKKRKLSFSRSRMTTALKELKTCIETLFAFFKINLRNFMMEKPPVETFLLYQRVYLGFNVNQFTNMIDNEIESLRYQFNVRIFRKNMEDILDTISDDIKTMFDIFRNAKMSFQFQCVTSESFETFSQHIQTFTSRYDTVISLICSVILN